MRALLLPIGVIAFIGAAATAACTATVSTGFAVSPGVPFFTYDGTALGSCSGDEYVTISDCGGCMGTTFYALCDDGAYTQCSCEVPTGSGWIVGGSGDDGGGPESGEPGETGGPEAGSPDGGGDDGGGPGEAGSDDGGGGGGGDDGGGGGDSGGGSGDS